MKNRFMMLQRSLESVAVRTSTEWMEGGRDYEDEKTRLKYGTV